MSIGMNASTIFIFGDVLKHITCQQGSADGIHIDDAGRSNAATAADTVCSWGSGHFGLLSLQTDSLDTARATRGFCGH
jgi:hypothetical protein